MIADWNDLDERVRMARYLARQLEDPRMFPETEAAVYAFREVYDVPVDRTADELDVSKQRVYNATSDVRDRVEAMRETIDLIDSDDLPTPMACEECGNGLDQWVFDSDGRPICPPCAGVSNPRRPPDCELDMMTDVSERWGISMEDAEVFLEDIGAFGPKEDWPEKSS